MALPAEKLPIEAHLESLSCGGSPKHECSDDSESSDDAGSEDGLWRPGGLCREEGSVSAAETAERRAARRKLYLACGVCLVFMIGEVVGGYAAQSLAIMTDAAHLLTDFCSIVISIFSLWLSTWPQTHAMTFGWHRAEVLGMMLSMLSIWAVTALLVASAAQRISDGDYDIDSRIMLITSGCAVAVNILMILILHQSGASHGHGLPAKRSQGSGHNHGHGNGHNHGHGNGHNHGHGNASVKAAFVHVVGDLVQSIGVVVAAAIIYFWPEYKVADPICTFLFSVLVLGTTIPITKDVLRILMAGAPRGVAVGSVKERLLSVRGVASLHSLHAWSLNTNRSLVSVHLATEGGADAPLVLAKASKLLRSEFGFSSVTIQVEH